MVQAINGVLIALCTLIVWRQHRKEPLRGLCLAFFLLVSMPDSLSFSLFTDLPTVTVHRAILVVLFFCTLGSSSESPRLTQMSFGNILFCIAGSSLVSTIVSPFFIVSVKQYLYLIIEVLGTFWIVRSTIKSVKDGRRLINWIGAGLAFVAVVAVLERHAGLKVSDLFPRSVDESFFWALDHRLDVTSTYPHRILFGLACALGALKYLQDLVVYDLKTKQWIVILGVGVCLAALYYSLSRGPWLAFGVVCLVLFMVAGGKGLRWGGIFALVVCAVMLIRPGVWSTIADLGYATADAKSLKGSSFQWRFVVINTALSAMSEAGIMNFMFGFGGGSQIMTDFGKYEVSPGIWLPIKSWDCEYAAVLYDKGWIGLGLVFLLSVVGLVRIINLLRWQVDKETRGVALSVLLGVLFFAVARTNVALYAPQLVYTEMAFLGIGSFLLDRRTAAKLGRSVLARTA